jgi:hypothetical protein
VDEEKYPLADLLKSLGREIRKAQTRAKDDPEGNILKLRECEVELGVTWTGKAGGEASFWVLKLGGEVTKENTTTLKLVLDPIGTVEVERTKLQK